MSTPEPAPGAQADTPDIPDNFMELTEAEQEAAVRAAYPWVIEDRIPFVTAIERGELRDDVGNDVIQSDLDAEEEELAAAGKPIPEPEVPSGDELPAEVGGKGGPPQL